MNLIKSCCSRSTSQPLAMAPYQSLLQFKLVLYIVFNMRENPKFLLWNKKFLIHFIIYTNFISLFAHMFLFCFYPWSYILNLRARSTVLLIFSVSSSTYFVIYSKKYVLYWGKFESRVWSVQCLVFDLFL